MTDTVKLIEWLDECARYFENRDTKGEDMAFWANVINAQNVRDIKERLIYFKQMEDALERLSQPGRYSDARAMIARQALEWKKQCPFEYGPPAGIKPTDPCPVCGDLGDIESVSHKPSNCVMDSNKRRRMSRA